jgi:flavin-dependent dehydrogenase
VSGPLDVIVVGAGPAGSACAIALAAAGREVALIDRPQRFVRAGDVLPPEVRPVLQELGVWDSFKADGHVASPGILTAWGQEEPVAQDYIWSPYGNGWNVDRRRFDSMLVETAAGAGAIVHRATRATAATPRATGWRVALERGGDVLAVDAAFLVDATGRTAALTPHTVAPTRAHDRLVGVVATASAPVEDGWADPRLLLEATPSGWWYSALLPGSRAVIAWMTDPKPGAMTARDLRELWLRELRRAPHTRARISSTLGVEPRVVVAKSCRRRAARGRRIAVGDAACAYDPLSGRGVMRALETGLSAAAAIVAGSDEHGRPFDAYANSVDEDFERFLRLKAAYYEAENRWPKSPFWKRRRSEMAAFTSRP